ncbi:hypothetical protein F511_15533 [Dorcoceras hygrometricum]|uniref:Uncharacterized protein n=1 Tax=Dorcoceras hygrometricum TaxID=472368 RepID=A0A2Z7AL13_9LAMI|nr:hypothetical protein F511_15533 [Dorcoceras hygrometricum]
MKSRSKWPPPSSPQNPPPPPPPTLPSRFARICFGQLDEENPSAPISSGLLVQADEGVSLPVVDLIDWVSKLRRFGLALGDSAVGVIARNQLLRETSCCIVISCWLAISSGYCKGFDALFYSAAVIPGFTAGRGFSPAGGVPGG